MGARPCPPATGVAEYGIEEMCADSWNWQKKNPDGYHTAN